MFSIKFLSLTLTLFVTISSSVIVPSSPSGLQRRDEPNFPPNIPSCPICQANYGSIDSCAEACAVFANPADIIFDPASAISVIKCACTDTFQAAFPQCVDCFTQTNQTAVFNTSVYPDLPSVLSGMRQVCALASTLLGNVSNSDGETPSSTSSTIPSPTTSSRALPARIDIPHGWSLGFIGAGCVAGLLLML